MNDLQLSSICSIEHTYDSIEQNQVYTKIFSEESGRKFDFYFS